MEAFHVAPGSYGQRRYSSIIVLDEIDMLMTRDQAVSSQLGCWCLIEGVPGSSCLSASLRIGAT